MTGIVDLLMITETDLPRIEVDTSYSYPIAQTTDGEFTFSVEDEDADFTFRLIKAHLAYWLWLKRNPELAKPLDREAVSQLVSDIEESDADEIEDIAAFLVRNGWSKG